MAIFMPLTTRQLKALKAESRRTSIYNKSKELDTSYQLDEIPAGPPQVTSEVLDKAFTHLDRSPDPKVQALASSFKPEGSLVPKWVDKPEHWLAATEAVGGLWNDFKNPWEAVAHVYKEIGGSFVDTAVSQDSTAGESGKAQN